MFKIEKISTAPLQEQYLTLEDGSQVFIRMYFSPLQLGWFFREISYGGFTVTNFRICNNPNILRQFKNLLPFGMACFSKQDREPSLQEDFASDASQLFILTAAEVEEYEDFLSG